MPHTNIELHLIDYILLITYFVFVLGIGFVLRRTVSGSKDFFESGRSLPAWVCALGFIGANLGAQEVMGMAASGAKYGIMTSHFYWVGAIPAMVFVAIFMMPFYYGSKARSVPEYLKLRFDEKTRTFNAGTFAVMTIMSSGISMFALAKLLNAILGWNFHGCIVASGVIVLVYIFMGGLTSAIYNEVLQFFLIVLGFLPLVILGLIDVGGWDGLVAKLVKPAVDAGFAPGTFTQSWAHTGSASANPMGVEWFGLAMGLGFVLSFGYWCTDFLVIQRSMAAKDMGAARRTPLLAAVPKMLFPALVILPGLIAIALHTSGGSLQLPTANGSVDYNMVVPTMLAHYFPTGMLGLGLTALMASFMSGMAGNVTAFNTVWTYDLYQTLRRWWAKPRPATIAFADGRTEQIMFSRPEAPDTHYLWMGRVTTVVGILLSMGAAYAAASWNNIMDTLQLVFAFVNAPLFATFLLGMFWKRTTGHGAFFGLIAGTLAAAIHHGISIPVGAAVGMKGGWLTIVHTYPSDMAQNFWTAIFAWTTCFVATILISTLTRQKKTDAELGGLVYSLTPKIKEHDDAWWKRPAVLGSVILVAAAGLNLLFW
jgi:solute:Na+ symporter, SSS family